MGLGFLTFLQFRSVQCLLSCIEAGLSGGLWRPWSAIEGCKVYPQIFNTLCLSRVRDSLNAPVSINFLMSLGYSPKNVMPLVPWQQFPFLPLKVIRWICKHDVIRIVPPSVDSDLICVFLNNAVEGRTGNIWNLNSINNYHYSTRL
jgi:hypothetical protein